ncbi:alpha/beta-hydrolase [Meredithblackwellia eburnea MCA 4105]
MAGAPGFIDYSKRINDLGQSEEQPELSEKAPSTNSKGKRRKSKSGRQDYADYSTRDLEKEAELNHDEPLGNFMGQGRQKHFEGDEEAYIGVATSGFDHQTDFRRPQADTHNVDRNALRRNLRGDEEYGDIGRSGVHEEYEEKNYGRPSSFAHPRDAPRPTGRYNSAAPNYLNPHTVPLYPTPTFVRTCFLTGFQIGSFLMTSLAFNLLFFISLFSYITHKLNPFAKNPPRGKVDKEWEQRISGERFSARAEYYANFWGYECEDIDVETEDGFVLRLHHLISKKHKAIGHPVILQHGILSNSVTWMVNEERSLAFWLVEQGYDVYLSNIRTNFEMPHRQFKRSDPRYWAWSFKEIGIYDLPAIIDYVHTRTGVKPAYIGHSQGGGTMFLALSKGMRPDIGEKISCFVALCPAVYAGPVLRKFPFSLMRKFRARWLWSFVFGVREFIPIISLLQRVLPSWLFGHAAFPVFAYIFGFHDHNWLNRQIPKFFRGVAVATSSELLYYYMNVFSYENCIFDSSVSEPWFPNTFPPLAVFYGTLDTLVLGRPLVDRLRQSEPNVDLAKVVSLENYEHLDPLFGVNAVEDCYLAIRDMIEETRGRR